MMHRRFHQRPHIRHSRHGRRYVAGRRRKNAPVPAVPPVMRRLALQEEHESLIKDLKQHHHGKIKGIGSFLVKTTPASKGGKHIMAFGKPMVTKARPARHRIRFHAAQALKEAVL